MRNSHFFAFGWRIDRHELDAGEVMKVRYAADTRADRAVNWSLWVKGGADCIEHPPSLAGSRMVARKVAGDCSKRDYPGKVWPAGTYRWKAFAPTAFVCVNAAMQPDKKAPPKLDIEFVPAGGTLKLRKGQLVVVVEGRLDLGAAPAAIEVTSEQREVTALADTHLFIFPHRRPQ